MSIHTNMDVHDNGNPPFAGDLRISCVFSLLGLENGFPNYGIVLLLQTFNAQSVYDKNISSKSDFSEDNAYCSLPLWRLMFESYYLRTLLFLFPHLHTSAGLFGFSKSETNRVSNT